MVKLRISYVWVWGGVPSGLQELTWKDEVERLIHEWTEDKEEISTKELLGLFEFYETHRDDFPSFWKPPARNFKRLRQAESRFTIFKAIGIAK